MKDSVVTRYLQKTALGSDQNQKLADDLEALLDEIQEAMEAVQRVSGKNKRYKPEVSRAANVVFDKLEEVEAYLYRAQRDVGSEMMEKDPSWRPRRLFASERDFDRDVNALGKQLLAIERKLGDVFAEAHPRKSLLKVRVWQSLAKAREALTEARIWLSKELAPSYLR